MNINNVGLRTQSLQAEAINLAKANEPDFNGARDLLMQAENTVEAVAQPLSAAVFTARTINDLGVIDVREGLYERSHNGAPNETALEHVSAGITQIEFSYQALQFILENYDSELRRRDWQSSVHAHVAGTMNTWFRATQTAQLLQGQITPDKRANLQAVNAQWMLGRGKDDEPGAFVHGLEGDNGYWSTQTSFLGLRGERINGHIARAIKWGMVRGVPEATRRLQSDPANRKAIVQTVGRLSSESITRKRAMAAALDYRKF